MNDNVNKENRKALPKFALIMLGAAAFGGVLGFLSGWMGRSSAPDLAVEALGACLGRVIPWLIPAASLVLLAAAVWQYRRARRLFEEWDGEEEGIGQAESRLNWVLLFAAVTMVLNFFLLSAAPYSQLPHGAPVGVAAFLLSIAAVLVVQQKAVDLTRRINPEKQGNVYDMDFQKKWLESCDEAEKQQIGQAAYRVYRAVGTACTVCLLEKERA